MQISALVIFIPRLILIHFDVGNGMLNFQVRGLCLPHVDTAARGDNQKQYDVAHI